MKNKIKLVVFDIAGTTVADKGEIRTAFKQALQEYGYNIPVNRVNALMGYKKPDAIRMMVDEYEENKVLITDDYIASIHERFLQLMIDYYRNADEIIPLPGVLEVFRFLHDNDIRIGLDTGFSTHITEVILQRLGWLQDGVVDFAVSSNEVPAGRPAPYMIQRMMQMANITDANEVIKVGDTEVDIQEGKNAGCSYSVAITTGAFTEEELKPYQPSYIIHNMQELIPIIEGINQ